MEMKTSVFATSDNMDNTPITISFLYCKAATIYVWAILSNYGKAAYFALYNVEEIAKATASAVLEDL
jgi:hypothetical protein